MDSTITQWLFWLIGFVILVFLVRWIFLIDTIIENQKKQLSIFILIAKKLDIDPDQILKVENPQEYWNKYYEQKQNLKS